MIIAVDPEGSLIAPHSPEKIFHNFYVEGIGYAFLPRFCSQDNIVDKWLKSNDKSTFHYARRLICEEGLLVGGSSGALLWGALEIAKNFNLDSNKRIVSIFADTVRNYTTKILNDDWLLEKDLIDQEEYDKKYIEKPNRLFGDNEKIGQLGLKELEPINIENNVRNAIEEFQRQNIDYVI